ncbi:MAG TPA: hypothetical protein VFK02_02365 [Kofleriaceae bacterium]|nr:hypothetical protein [Kofleriaceae bacterium]
MTATPHRALIVDDSRTMRTTLGRIISRLPLRLLGFADAPP